MEPPDFPANLPFQILPRRRTGNGEEPRNALFATLYLDILILRDGWGSAIGVIFKDPHCILEHTFLDWHIIPPKQSRDSRTREYSRIAGLAIPPLLRRRCLVEVQDAAEKFHRHCAKLVSMIVGSTRGTEYLGRDTRF